MPVCDLSPRTQGSVRCHYIDRTAAGGRRGYESDRTQNRSSTGHSRDRRRNICDRGQGPHHKSYPMRQQRPFVHAAPYSCQATRGWLNRPVPLSPVSLGWLLQGVSVTCRRIRIPACPIPVDLVQGAIAAGGSPVCGSASEVAHRFPFLGLLVSFVSRPVALPGHPGSCRSGRVPTVGSVDHLLDLCVAIIAGRLFIRRPGVIRLLPTFHGLQGKTGQS